MNRSSQLDMFQSFIERQEQRSKIQIGGEMQAIFDYCEYVIHTEYDKKSKTKYKFKQRKNQLSQDFMRAYSTLQKQDKITYYIKNVIYLIRITTGNMKMPKIRQGIMQTTAYTLSYNIRRWKQKKMRLDNDRQVMFGQKNGVIKQYDLGNYIFRGSKNSKYFTFVLQAIKDTVHSKAKTVHVGFQSLEVMKQWAEAVQLCIDYRHWKRLYIQIYKKPPPKQTKQTQSPVSKKQPQTKISQNVAQKSQQKQQQKSLIIKKTQQPQLFSSSPTSPMKKVSQSILVQKITYQKAQGNQSSSSSSEHFYSDSDNQNKMQQVDQLQRTIIEDLVEGEAPGIDNMESIEHRNDREKKNVKIKNLNIFHKMFPEFEFNEVELDINYEMIHSQKSFRILQHNQEKQRFKLFMQFNQNQTPAEYIFKTLCNLEFLKSYNQNVQQSQIKTFISSENAAIMYLVLKPFNRIYRPRDFVFIRHTFKIGPNTYYIADKDIQNSHFPPFMTIVRGKYEFIWTIIKKDKGLVKLVGNFFIDNSGYLSDMQNTNLTLNYLKNYGKIGDFIRNNKDKLANFGMFDSNWDITMNVDNVKQNQARIVSKKHKIKQRKQKQIDQMPKSESTAKLVPNLVRQTYAQLPTGLENILPPTPTLSPRTKMSKKQQQLAIQRQKMNSQQVQGQIDPKDIKLQTLSNVKLQFDKNGMVIISNRFIKNKYPLLPVKDYPKIQIESTVPGKHPLWTDDWRHDPKKGGLLFVNAKKMEDQKGVLKFILSKIGKNLVSGKSILNISLPVDIFVAKSNLQLFIQSLCYAPILLQKAVPMNPFDKFKICVAFGISMSPLYLIMEKPFNPILGQTFQAWINGCPAYAEQISHHPPICSLLLYGRNYTISGQFQSKAEVHMNSGTGTNDGIFRINFDDGNKVRFCSAGGEVSGLTYGDRKFNIQGKAYCWSEPSNYFVEIVFNPSKKGFFSMKKQQQPQDYFQGQTFKVTPQFISSLYTKRRAPTEKQIVQSLGKFNGVWHQQMFYENQSLLNIGKQLPYKLQYEKYPLPSDSNWRQDIAYRRLMEVPRAQVEKQRLQNLQRSDRKLRGSKH